MLDVARLKSRLLNYPKYFFWHGVDLINRNYSLERPKVLKWESTPQKEIKDQTDSIEFYFFKQNNQESDFIQKNEKREEKVTNIKNKFETTNCFICEKVLTPLAQVINDDDHHDYIEMSWCKNCGHSQYSVMPTKEWITEWYNIEYDTSNLLENKLQTRKKTYRYYNRIKKFLPNKKLKILEIGAGYGEKIAPFKDDGHEIYCTEITSERANYLKDILHFNVFQGTLDDPSVREEILKNGPYDLIFSYHVIEHMYNPKEELQILKEVAADGALFYLAIPEFYKEGIINNIFNLEHLHSFSRSSGIRLMNEVGFNVIQHDSDYFQYYTDYCQYFIGKKEDLLNQDETQQSLEYVCHYLESSLKLKQISNLRDNSFAYKYNNHPQMNLYVSEETKKKCKNIKDHLPLKYYSKDLPLFIMQ